MLGPRKLHRPGCRAYAVLDVGLAQRRAAHHRLVQLAALESQLELHAAAQGRIARLRHPPRQVAGPRSRQECQRKSVAQNHGIHATANDGIAVSLRHQRRRKDGNRDARAGARPCQRFARPLCRETVQPLARNRHRARVDVNLPVQAACAQGQASAIEIGARRIRRESPTSPLPRRKHVGKRDAARMNVEQVPAARHGGNHRACRIDDAARGNDPNQTAVVCRETRVLADRRARNVFVAALSNQQHQDLRMRRAAERLVHRLGRLCGRQGPIS